MSPDDPRHGTPRQTWQTVPNCACRSCEDVRAARRRDYKTRTRRTTPAELPAHHIRRLLTQGWTQSAIAAAAGVGVATISEAVTGVARTMTVDNAAAIIGVNGEPRSIGMIPSTGTRRRLQSLVALGWLAQEVTARAGLAPRFLSDLVDHQQPTVNAKTAAAVAAVYNELCMTIPTETPGRKRSRTLAAQKGWVPPLAWDDIDRDPEPAVSDASGRLDPVVVMRLLQGDRVTATRAEKDAAMAQWIEQGGVQAELCRWHGWKEGRYGTGLRLVDGEAS